MTAIERILQKAHQLDSITWALACALADTLDDPSVTRHDVYRLIARYAENHPGFMADINAIASAAYSDSGARPSKAPMN